MYTIYLYIFGSLQSPRSPPIVPEVVKYFDLDDVRRDAEKSALGHWTVLKAPTSAVVLAVYDHELGHLVKRLVIHEDLNATLFFGGTCTH